MLSGTGTECGEAQQKYVIALCWVSLRSTQPTLEKKDQPQRSQLAQRNCFIIFVGLRSPRVPRAPRGSFFLKTSAQHHQRERIQRFYELFSPCPLWFVFSLPS